MFFPLRDHLRPERPPFANWLLILANVGAFAWMVHVCATPEELKLFVVPYGLVAANVRTLVAQPRLFFETPWQSVRDGVLPFVSHMFLHGGLAHLIGNLWFLWIFGDNVEGRLGARRYLVFYFVCGILAGALHVASIPPHVEAGSTFFARPIAGYHSLLEVPMVGASGAIAGVLGAYVVWFPRARVTTYLPPIFVFQMPAVVVLGFWFVMQFFAARHGVLVGEATIPVAYWAHVGGFVAGAALALLRPRRSVE